MAKNKVKVKIKWVGIQFVQQVALVRFMGDNQVGYNF